MTCHSIALPAGVAPPIRHAETVALNVYTRRPSSHLLARIRDAHNPLESLYSLTNQNNIQPLRPYRSIFNQLGEIIESGPKITVTDHNKAELRTSQASSLAATRNGSTTPLLPPRHTLRLSRACCAHSLPTTTDASAWAGTRNSQIPSIDTAAHSLSSKANLHPPSSSPT